MKCVKTEIIPKTNYLRNKDANLIQIMASKMFSNFNGGFGFYSDSEHVMQSPIDHNVSISFVTDKMDYNDMFMRTYNNLEFEYTPRLKSFRLPVEEVLFLICKEFDIDYSPDRLCVENCYGKFLLKQQDCE